MTDFTPNQNLADYFNQKEYFYCYDSATIISHLAALCGVKSIIIRWSRTKEELRMDYVLQLVWMISIELNQPEIF